MNFKFKKTLSLFLSILFMIPFLPKNQVLAANYPPKVVLVGDSQSGKTCLSKKFVGNKFAENESSKFGVKLYSKVVSVGDQKINLQLWDTSGQEKFRFLSLAYLNKANAVIFAVDGTQKLNSENLYFWIQEAYTLAPKKSKKLFIAITKKDCEEYDKNRKDAVLALKNTNQMSDFIDESTVFETSAETGEGIEELFNAVAVQSQIEKNVSEKAYSNANVKENVLDLKCEDPMSDFIDESTVFETSAATDEGVEDLFNTVARSAKEQHEAKLKKRAIIGVSIATAITAIGGFAAWVVHKVKKPTAIPIKRIPVSLKPRGNI